LRNVRKFCNLEAMPGVTTEPEILAGNITAARKRRRLQQADLAERMTNLGWKWVRQTVGEIEALRRKVSIEELIGLSVSLETGLGNLLLPIAGESRLTRLPAGQLIVLPLQHEMPGEPLGPVLWDGNTPRFTAPLAADELPVVAAIVTSRQGVLIGRRHDGTPPWTFIAGEQGPDELPRDTVEREVKEETGGDVAAEQIIGERDHPVTGRHMIYVAATPTRETPLIVGGQAELAEVRWASLAEAEELLPGMYGPVREYLVRELGGA
jgi:8-oxo-dGTP diphosphatase